MNWFVFAEVIVWAVTVVAGVAAYIAFMLLITEILTRRGERHCLLTLIIGVIVAVIGGATLAGMYSA